MIMFIYGEFRRHISLMEQSRWEYIIHSILCDEYTCSITVKRASKLKLAGYFNGKMKWISNVIIKITIKSAKMIKWKRYNHTRIDLAGRKPYCLEKTFL